MLATVQPTAIKFDNKSVQENLVQENGPVSEKPVKLSFVEELLALSVNTEANTYAPVTELAGEFDIVRPGNGGNPDFVSEDPCSIM